MAEVRADIPADRIVDFDVVGDPTLHRDVFARLAELSRGAPHVAYAPRSGGWLVFGRAEIQHVLENAKCFSSASLGGGNQGGPGYIPLSLDPPDHAPWRQLLHKFFGQQQVARLEPFIREWAERTIVPLKNVSTCDFVKAVAEPMPVSIFMIMLGLPLARIDEFREWATRAFEPDGNGRDASMPDAHSRIRGMLVDLIGERRRAPKEDLVSSLLAETVEGRPITSAEMLSICFLLFLAGLDTVTNAMTFSMRHLATDRAMHDALRRDRTLIPAALEKLLQLYTFVNTIRVATIDTVLDGVTIRAGEKVWCILWSGSNDATQPAGRSNRHLAFGSGHHFCLGSHLARLELRIMLETWLTNIGEMALAPGFQSTMRGGAVMRMSRLILSIAPVSEPDA